MPSARVTSVAIANAGARRHCRAGVAKVGQASSTRFQRHTSRPRSSSSVVVAARDVPHGPPAPRGMPPAHQLVDLLVEVLPDLLGPDRVPAGGGRAAAAARSWLHRREDEPDALPACARNLLTSRSRRYLARVRDRVHTDTPPTRGRVPPGLDPARPQHALQRGIQRPFLDLQKVVGGPLDVLHQRVAVPRLLAEGAGAPSSRGRRETDPCGRAMPWCWCPRSTCGSGLFGARHRAK